MKTLDEAKALLDAAEEYSFYGVSGGEYLFIRDAQDVFKAALAYAKAVAEAGEPVDLTDAIIDWRRNCC